jgi:hypothetical protein
LSAPKEVFVPLLIIPATFCEDFSPKLCYSTKDEVTQESLEPDNIPQTLP